MQSPNFLLASHNDESLLKARQLFTEGNYEQAIELFEKAAENNQSAFEAYLGVAIVLMEKGQYERAEQACEQALSSSPNHPDALTLKGEILQLTGDYAQARAHYQKALDSNPDHLRARLNLGKMQWQWGEKAAARRTLNHFISYYRAHSSLNAEELSIIAEGCIYLDRFRDANNLFHDATKADPKHWQAFIPWGNLFLSKYNLSDAVGVFEDALKINPNAAEAHLGLAKCFVQENFEKAQALADQALDINPKLVEAHNLKAEVEIAFADYQSALATLEEPLRVNPSSLTARTLRAVCFYFSGQDAKFAEEEAQILSMNPKYGDFYYQVGEMLARRYLFKESADFFRKAIALDPEHWGAHAGLGNSLSRLGEEEAAVEILERAFAKDPYNKHVGNLLTLFDEFPQYKTHDTGKGLLIRIHEKDDPVLSEYAVDLATESFTALNATYNFDKTKPVLLEIFPEHDDFAVRCFGIPGAQAFLGICFGNVVAMDSPRARTKGDFVWGETMWHELVHVTHLRMTENRIPRWLAEGIAVYETSTARPYWSMNLDMPFIQAFLNDQLLPLNELDSGFNRPTSPGQVSLSYFQASIVVEFLVKEYGLDRLIQTFPKFRQDLKTPEIFKSLYGKDLVALDDEFKAYVSEKYNIGTVDYSFDPKKLEGFSNAGEEQVELTLAEKPNNPFINYHAGIYYKRAGDAERAIELLNKAKSLFPGYVLGSNPYSALVEIYLEEDRKLDAVRELKLFTAQNGKEVEALTLLADLCWELGQNDCAIEALEKVLYISPFDGNVHKQLARAYVAEEKLSQAIKELEILLKTNPQDLAGAHCDLADVYLQAGQKSEAKASALKALEIAPNYERAQEILLACLQ